MLILVYTTFGSRQEADNIISHLLRKKLIACANIYQMDSMFVWNEAVKSSQETSAILKTGADNWDRLKKEITEMHSYDLPCIVRIEADANSPFEAWVNAESLSSPSSSDE